MKLELFDYPLPEGLIAQFPLTRRDQARLMVIDRASQTIRHDIFANLEKYLPPQSLIVLNDSKVVHARLLGAKERSGGRIEIFLLKKLSDGYTYETLLRPMAKIKNHDIVRFKGSDVTAEIIDREKKIVRFSKKNLDKFLETQGHVPLPPYIKRADRASDKKYYQTVYAKNSGSVAAPTAGLHFTDRLLEKLGKRHKIAKVTLHVNYGTFRPVEKQNVLEHKMHEEAYSVPSRAYQAILNQREKGKKIVAVGTTSCRVLESIARTGKREGSTDLFLYPGCPFQLTDVLVTNFHLPLSTLLVLVYAFGGIDLTKRAYKEAMEQKYRFYSYGDAMVII